MSIKGVLFVLINTLLGMVALCQLVFIVLFIKIWILFLMQGYVNLFKVLIFKVNLASKYSHRKTIGNQTNNCKPIWICINQCLLDTNIYLFLNDDQNQNWFNWYTCLLLILHRSWVWIKIIRLYQFNDNLKIIGKIH